MTAVIRRTILRGGMIQLWLSIPTLWCRTYERLLTAELAVTLVGLSSRQLKHTVCNSGKDPWEKGFITLLKTVSLIHVLQCRVGGHLDCNVRLDHQLLVCSCVFILMVRSDWEWFSLFNNRWLVIQTELKLGGGRLGGPQLFLHLFTLGYEPTGQDGSTFVTSCLGSSSEAEMRKRVVVRASCLL